MVWSRFYLCFLFGIAVAQDAEVSVSQVKGEFQISPGKPSKDSVAWGTFQDGLQKTGWGILNVRASGQFSDELQHEAAGVVEGFLTAKHIHTAYLNAVGYVFHGNVSRPSVQFLKDQVSWAWKQVKANPDDNFWVHVGAILAQLRGLEQGYALASTKNSSLPKLEDSAFLILNGVGDLFQIMPAVDEHWRRDFDAMSSKQLRTFVKTTGMCSALIKVPGDFEDLFMAHSSWFSYGDTDRIFKHYHFEFHAATGANRISFSSYPGYLESLDDFYMMDSGLGMVQTSNNLLNNTLLKLIKPESLLAWQRVRAASAIAKTGKEWYEAFKKHASGTYVNQYMVVDFKLFKPRTALKDGTLWVTEEMPGLVVGADQTDTLSRGYWPSYNVPYYPEIYKGSGYVDDRLGPDGQYELAPRAKIFRRDQSSVVDMASFKRIMRYANYTDPYAKDEHGNVDYSAAICMRGDLGKNGEGFAGGCYDTKVTSYNNGFWERKAEIVNGPSSTSSDGTHGKSENPPFEWRANDANTPHFGLPEKYDFDFITTSAETLQCEACLEATPIVV
eukprot:TRINITY_DN16861_c0_g1_i1.p1 TRINITY_DN16861_c0_g1~~TRINITY_DN16861_c0_g1_i1.p1  ORF type:complete len:581 (-),score=106.92 TRINITY_DN16861_c0_g1_i1:191-1861(-)